MDAYAREFYHMPKHTGTAAWTVEAAPEALNEYNSAFDLIPFHDNAFVSDLESLIAGKNVLDQEQDEIVDAQDSISVQGGNGQVMASASANLNSTQTTTDSEMPGFFGGWSRPQPDNPYAMAEVTRQLTLDDVIDFSKPCGLIHIQKSWSLLNLDRQLQSPRDFDLAHQNGTSIEYTWG
jgi:hypothetical protein